VSKKKKKKRTTWQRAIVFFYGNVLTKKVMITCCHHLLLWWCYGLIWWFLSVYKVQGTIKEEFVANVVHAEMQRCHLYIACHATKATNVATSY
jgi:hypothetical protein